MLKLDTETEKSIDALWQSTRADLHDTFVAKDEVADLMIVSLVAGEHLLIVGPPGTAKTAIVHRLVQRIDARRFEYLLTRFTEPNEIFGPVDMKLYTEKAQYRRLTESMLPDAHVAFLDEIFKANSAILNALLSVLNERVFFNGRGDGRGVERVKLPLLSVFAASNTIPDDPEFAALVDRFPVRVRTQNVSDGFMPDMVRCAWAQEQLRIGLEEDDVPLASYTTPDEIQKLTRLVPKVDVTAVEAPLLRFASLARTEGLEISDRALIRLFRLTAASALLRRSPKAALEDLWVLRHSWRHENQTSVVDRLVRDVAGDIGPSRRAHRPLEAITRDIEGCAARDYGGLSDAERLAALHSIEVLRRELAAHPAEKAKCQPLDNQLGQVVEQILGMISR